MPDRALGHGPQLLRTPCCRAHCIRSNMGPGAARQQGWGRARLSSMPSVASSFRTRGLPQVGLDCEILRMRSRISRSRVGRPGLPARLLRVHRRLNPARASRSRWLAARTPAPAPSRATLVTGWPTGRDRPSHAAASFCRDRASALRSGDAARDAPGPRHVGF